MKVLARQACSGESKREASEKKGDAEEMGETEKRGGDENFR